jgi:L-gulonate 3-dehydrogenase
MSKIALVGLGLAGRARAVSFARAGHEVLVWDDRPEVIGEALAFVNRTLPELDANDLMRGEATPLVVRSHIRRAGSLEEALERAAHVQENTPEDRLCRRRPPGGDITLTLGPFRPRNGEREGVDAFAAISSPVAGT